MPNELVTRQSEEELIVSQQRSIESDRSMAPISLAQMLNELGLSGRRIPAEELIDREFVILRARTFPSSFQEGANPWFCLILLTDTGEIATTVLGGKAVVEVLDAWASTGRREPLKVRLAFHEGRGRYKGYYTLE